MSTKIYKKIENRISTFHEIVGYYNINWEKDKEFGFKDWLQHFGRLIPFESQSYTIEFDQFIRENQDPAKYEKYLNPFLEKYVVLDSHFDKLLSWQKNTNALFDINLRSKCIKEIIEYLKGLLNTETHKPPKPKGQTQLNRNQTGLLFWYLREKSLIAPMAENKNIAKAIELMTGHSAGIMADILKKPQTEVCKLGKDKPVNKNDFDIVINELENLIKRIKTDRRRNIENGELN